MKNEQKYCSTHNPMVITMGNAVFVGRENMLGNNWMYPDNGKQRKEWVLPLQAK